MKRFKVQTGDDHALLLYYRTQAEAQEHWPDATIEEYNDQSHVKYIQRMMEAAVICKTGDRNSFIVHAMQLDTPVGACIVHLFQDGADGVWLDFCKYQLWNRRGCGALWAKFLKVEYAMLTQDKNGPKPRELRGIKKFASVPFGVSQYKCPLYLKGDDLYINHADYFSPILPNGKINPMTHLPDRTVYIRKVWLRITNFVPMVKIMNASQIVQKVWPMIREYHGWPPYEYNMEWERFLEAVAEATSAFLAQILHNPTIVSL